MVEATGVEAAGKKDYQMIPLNHCLQQAQPGDTASWADSPPPWPRFSILLPCLWACLKK